MNIIQHVLGSSRTFEEQSFSEVDAFLLAEFSYARLEAIANKYGKGWMRRSVVRDYYKAEFFAEMFNDGITDEENKQLVSAFAASRRFRDMRIMDITSVINPEVQFAAMIFEINPGTYLVAFRGTDGTLVGWREDFELSYRDEIPAQKAAAEYIDRFWGPGGPLEGSRLYLAGHSKGGNLAVYAACMCMPEIRKNIIEAFSFDGPGFSEKTRKLISEAVFKQPVRITRIIPPDSVVGILLSGYGECKVIKSNAWGIMQHSGYSWEVENGEFIYLDAQNWGSEYLNRTITKWLEEATDEQRRTVVEAIFDTLEANNLRSITDLRSLSRTDILALLKEIKRLDPETQEVISNIVKSLAVSAAHSIRH